MLAFQYALRHLLPLLEYCRRWLSSACAYKNEQQGNMRLTVSVCLERLRHPARACISHIRVERESLVRLEELFPIVMVELLLFLFFFTLETCCRASVI